MSIKLSISNMAWTFENDQRVYEYIHRAGFEGIEVAPTRLFSEKPYEKLTEARNFAEELFGKYGLEICSIQSIWYGRNERMFGSDKERKILLEYTKKAIDFAETVKARNIVFGCPKNRIIQENDNREIAVRFFRETGDYAAKHGTVLAIEANPQIYGTNFINRTNEAIELIEEVNSKGFKLNLDFGTIVHNKESIDGIASNIDLINHVHISEPNLKMIEHRSEHKDLFEILRMERYNGYVSIEMGKCEDINDVFKTIDYVAALQYNI